jgi:hypothetical protein
MRGDGDRAGLVSGCVDGVVKKGIYRQEDKDFDATFAKGAKFRYGVRGADCDAAVR